MIYSRQGVLYFNAQAFYYHVLSITLKLQLLQKLNTFNILTVNILHRMHSDVRQEQRYNTLPEPCSASQSVNLYATAQSTVIFTSPPYPFLSPCNLALLSAHFTAAFCVGSVMGPQIVGISKYNGSLSMRLRKCHNVVQ